MPAAWELLEEGNVGITVQGVDDDAALQGRTSLILAMMGATSRVAEGKYNLHQTTSPPRAFICSLMIVLAVLG